MAANADLDDPLRAPRRTPLRTRLHSAVAALYARQTHRWLLLAPLLGLITGLLITVLNVAILRHLWPALLARYLQHPVLIVPCLGLGFALAGWIMQRFTADPDCHSTEEIVEAYHHHEGRVAMRAFIPKLLAAAATVGCGGSAALEGPSIYGGGALGAWMWTRLRRFRLPERDRRLLLISGAAAGMAAVFRAPLTGLVFALEMPYIDDLAHEALVPSLLAAVVAYMTMAAFLGATPIFDFRGPVAFTRRDLFWCALLGLIIGGIALAFTLIFRSARRFMIALRWPHWAKLGVGGVLTGLCGLAFLAVFHGNLVPIGPNYEAVQPVLGGGIGVAELIAFGIVKLAATLFSLACGGVSAMFVPLFLSGGSFGAAFGRLLVPNSPVELYAAVGMAAFLAAGYKTPLAAVTFIAEATGGHAFLIPALVGAAVAYAVSGDISVSAAQLLRRPGPTTDAPAAVHSYTE